MNLDVNALALLLISAAIFGAAKLLLSRLSEIEHTLEGHGRKLVRIETRLNVPETLP